MRKDKLNVLYCYSQVCDLAAMVAVEFVRQRLSGHGTGLRVAVVEGRWVQIESQGSVLKG